MNKDQGFKIDRFIERPNELRNIPFDVIDIDFEKNKRIDYGNIDWLAESILTNGLKNPLVLYVEACEGDHPKALFFSGSKSHPKGYYRLVVQDGHRRFKALDKAINELGGGEKLRQVPCRGTTKAETREERLLNQILMNSGKNFEPIEIQAVFKELNSFGWSPEKIAQQANVSPMHVRKMLELSSADELTKYMIERGEISSNLVIETLGEVRQLAQLEGKSENEVYSELANESTKSSGGKVKAADFKQKLEQRRSQKLLQSDPMYYQSLDSIGLVNRMSKCVGVVKEDFTVVTMPTKLWEAIKAKGK